MHYFEPGKGGRPRVVGAWIRGLPFTFFVPPGVFSSKRVDKGTELLAEYMDIPEEGKVLDLGCGYGVLGIVMAKLNPKLEVYMVDVNPVAVEAAKRNVEANGVRAIVLQGNLYQPVDELGVSGFSTIVSNPPLAAGRGVLEEIIVGARERLRKGGSLQLVLAKGGEWAEERMREIFTEVEHKRKKGYSILKGYA